MDMIQEQERIEAMSKGMTLSRFQDQMTYRLDKAQETTTSYGVGMLKRAVQPVMIAIEEFKAAAGKTAGPRHRAIMYLEQVPTDVAAYMTAKVVLDQITLNNRLQKAALQVGTAIEDEVRWRKFEAEAGGLWKKLQADHVGEQARRKRVVLVHAYNKYIGEWVGWNQIDKVHLGMKLIEMFIERTGFAEVETRFTAKNKTMKFIAPSATVVEWIESTKDNAALLQPVHLPMVVSPAPWEGPYGGGYLTISTRPQPLVKTPNRNYLAELQDMPEQMADVYHAVNTLQDVRWAINKGTLGVMRDLWERGIAVAKLPPREPQPLPPSPVGRGRDTKSLTDDEKVLFREWKRKATRVYAYNTKLRTRRMQIGKVMAIAGEFEKYEEIFFPYTLDFRGRVYALPMFLNPQGNDQAKGLLQFAEGKALGTGRAAGWLAIHGANTYGYDKASLEDRISWVEEHSDQIEATGNDPLADLWWTKADKPWGFLAFCMEWAGYCREGLAFKSHLPIAMDGSCSGLQHFSAALRDPIGGAAVNLVPANEPADVYQQVIDKAVAQLRLDLTKGEKELDAELVAKILEFGLTRNTAKRATMTVPYGSTRFSCRDFIAEYINETTEDRREKDREYISPLNEFEFPASLVLAEYVWDAIGETVIAARKAMDWLRSTAKVLSKEGLPVHWTTRDGFPIVQAYTNTDHRRVKTKFGDSLIYLTIAEDTGDELDARRQANGVAPNWVHSMDGTHLRMAVSLASDNGVNSFAVVHDSFGTHAADTDMLATCLKQTFVELYEGSVLQDFADQVAPILSTGADIPPVPPMGSLDLDGVKQSDFVFA